MKSIAIVVTLIFAGSVHAATVTIDFEDVPVGAASNFVSNGFNFAVLDPLQTPQIAVDAGGDQSLSMSNGALCNAFGDCGTFIVTMTLVGGGTFGYLGGDIDVSCADEITGSCSGGAQGFLADGSLAMDPEGSGDWLNLESVRFVVGASGVPGGFQGYGMSVDNVVVNVVPIPAAVWLFGSALLGLGWLRRTTPR